MKKYILTFFFISTILWNGNTFAGTTTLTTFYPPPTAAYNQVKLTTNTSTSTNCATSSDGTVFFNSTTGSFNVCMGGANKVYPQACYNSFCNFSSPALSCAVPATCSSGFGYLQTDGTVLSTTGNAVIDTFQVSSSPKTYTDSYVCCSD